VTGTLSEIEAEVNQAVGMWRSQTLTEQRNDLSYLDDLLGELDDVATGSGTTAEMVEDCELAYYLAPFARTKWHHLEHRYEWETDAELSLQVRPAEDLNHLIRGAK